jgi:hypothetical protein
MHGSDMSAGLVGADAMRPGCNHVTRDARHRGTDKMRIMGLGKAGRQANTVIDVGGIIENHKDGFERHRRLSFKSWDNRSILCGMPVERRAGGGIFFCEALPAMSDSGTPP